MGRKMDRSGMLMLLMPMVIGVVLLAVCASSALCAELDPSAPSSPVKLIFIHHSTGQNWLADDNGGLGISLRDNNYFVSDTNYGWGPDSIGSSTDIGNWYDWFNGASSATYTAALYVEYGQNSSYSRMGTDPGGENEIIMFKSCFPNSYLRGNPDDPATTGANPLRGQGAGSEEHTVGNAKGIYNDLLTYFATRRDKLFVVIAAPPLQTSSYGETTYAANARAFNEWLYNEWLKDYPYSNVAVYDFYNVLTTNGGNADTNDLGLETGNHHRWWGATVQHKSDAGSNVLKYPTSEGDDHPTQAGNLKATGEYVQVLNVFYHNWKGTAACAYTVAPTEKAVSSSGGKFTAKVTASGASTCPAPSVTSSDWITTVFPGLKKNKGTLKVSVQANPDATARTGTVVVDETALTVAQAAAPCKIKSLTPANAQFQKAGDDGAFTVAATNGCAWAVSQDGKSASWLHITSGSTGTGTGTVGYTVDENLSKPARTGKFTITLTTGSQKKAFTVKQK